MTGRPELTRRAALGGAATVAASALLAPSAVAETIPAQAARVFALRVGALDGLSAVITPGRAFVLAGLEWSGAAVVRIELRSRTAAGTWGRWSPASISGHAPDRGVDGGGRFGEALWLGRSDALQLRSSDPVAGVRVHFVAPAAANPAPASAAAFASPAGSPALAPPAGSPVPVSAAGSPALVSAAGSPALVSAAGSPALVSAAGSPALASAAAPASAGLVPAEAFPLATPVLPAGAGQPPIIARSAWAGDSAPPSAGPFYGEVRLAFVHHSDNPNGYSAADVPSMILSIYDYHRFVHGWFDIGYNFVIDAFGRVWEARAGGIDEPVIGAQAGGYNAVSTGVVVLGTYMDTLPSPAALDALQGLLAWKLPLHGIPALGTVIVEVDPASAYYTPFAPGQRVPLPRIAGHRQGDTTDCPGDDLYAHLPVVRARVDALAGVPTQLTLRASRTTVGPATPLVLAGRLASLHGSPLAGAPVAIQTITGLGTETTIATATTDADGNWVAGVTLARSETVRALYALAPAAVSTPVAIGLAPAITLTLASTAPLRVTGTIDPAPASKPASITIDVYRPAGSARRLVATRTVSAAGGRFAARLTLTGRARGDFEIVARSAASDAFAAGASPPLAVTP